MVQNKEENTAGGPEHFKALEAAKNIPAAESQRTTALCSQVRALDTGSLNAPGRNHLGP